MVASIGKAMLQAIARPVASTPTLHLQWQTVSRHQSGRASFHTAPEFRTTTQPQQYPAFSVNRYDRLYM
jgi:hypothetical protein